MTVGDVNSDQPGSGARYNDGKLQMDLIPVCYWLENWSNDPSLLGRFPELSDALEALSAFQLGEHRALDAFLATVSPGYLESATRVLEYGSEKYAAWNWAKGMAWSIPTGCALRHAKSLLEGEVADPESGEAHIGHVVCNLLMLAWFVDHYPEGDDRPPVRNGN